MKRSKTITLDAKQQAYLLDVLLERLEAGCDRWQLNHDTLLAVYNAVADKQRPQPDTIRTRVLRFFDVRRRVTRQELIDWAIRDAQPSAMAYATAAQELCRDKRLRKIKPGVYGRAVA